ncbi:hypothetical protein XcuCFBP2542_11235 [Xanthomonas cucurbitae]|uniref:Uncharacterized protein n=1 Tax=Xanthomonas cucurbitae TaxID=56453 RepID=A0A2S7DR50_9XANT|nr:hypothetical protein XcuCFBP2542_11235 [Xanthomonas cucurbitae]
MTATLIFFLFQVIIVRIVLGWLFRRSINSGLQDRRHIMRGITIQMSPMILGAWLQRVGTVQRCGPLLILIGLGQILVIP